MTIKVLVNTLPITEDNEGIRTMLCELLPRLISAAPASVDWKVLVSDRNRRLFEDSSLRCAYLEAPAPANALGRVLVEQICLLFLGRKVDVVLMPSSAPAVAIPRVPQVVLFPFHLALPSARVAANRRLPFAKRFYYDKLIPRLLSRESVRVAAISEWLATGLIDELGLDPRNVAAWHLGVSAPHHLEGYLSHVRTNVLFVGTLYPYKNASLVVDAFAHCLDDLPHDCSLELVGRDPFDGQIVRLREQAARLGVENRVVIHGGLSQAELEDSYRRAAVFALPSACEGFGLPVLEAMSRSVPVVTSDRTALPEVVDNAGICVPIDGHVELAAAIRDVLVDETLRDDLIAAGKDRAEVLSWESSAKELWDIIDRAGRR